MNFNLFFVELCPTKKNFSRSGLCEQGECGERSASFFNAQPSEAGVR
jgi:hypothetical protein